MKSMSVFVVMILMIGAVLVRTSAAQGLQAQGGNAFDVNVSTVDDGQMTTRVIHADFPWRGPNDTWFDFEVTTLGGTIVSYPDMQPYQYPGTFPNWGDYDGSALLHGVVPGQSYKLRCWLVDLITNDTILVSKSFYVSQ